MLHIVLDENTNSFESSFVVIVASYRRVSPMRVAMAETSTQDLEAFQAGVEGFVPCLRTLLEFLHKRRIPIVWDSELWFPPVPVVSCCELAIRHFGLKAAFGPDDRDIRDTRRIRPVNMNDSVSLQRDCNLVADSWPMCLVAKPL